MKNLQKPLIFAAIIILGGVLFWGYFFDRKDTKKNGAQSQFEPQIHSVYLNEDGFVPEKLVIRTGDIVKFTSNKKSWFWPASNPHPSHTTYALFDPKKPLAAQESWDFKFEQVGEWRYHDHLAPYFTGIIIVKN